MELDEGGVFTFYRVKKYEILCKEVNTGEFYEKEKN